MSQNSNPTSLEAEAGAALAAYDQSRRPDALRHAADVIGQQDGNAPDDPAEALAEGRTRVALWIALFGRFRRDIDADFDPDHPPSLKPKMPVIRGQMLRPFTSPSDLKDPADRKILEDVIADNDRKVAQYESMSDLFAIHATVLEQAVNSLRDARDVLGLPDAEIIAMLEHADIAPRDRDALREGFAA